MLINYSLNIKEFEGATFNVTTGDYSALMRLVCDNLEKARENAANDEERDMITGYVKSFTEVSWVSDLILRIDEKMLCRARWTRTRTVPGTGSATRAPPWRPTSASSRPTATPSG